MTGDSLVVPCRRQPQPANNEVRQIDNNNQRSRVREACVTGDTLSGRNRAAMFAGPAPWVKSGESADGAERLGGPHGGRAFQDALAVDHVAMAANDAGMGRDAALDGGQLLVT